MGAFVSDEEAAREAEQRDAMPPRKSRVRCCLDDERRMLDDRRCWDSPGAGDNERTVIVRNERERPILGSPANDSASLLRDVVRWYIKRLPWLIVDVRGFLDRRLSCTCADESGTWFLPAGETLQGRKAATDRA